MIASTQTNHPLVGISGRATGPQPDEAGALAAQPHIVVVDESDEVRAHVCEMLQRNGFNAIGVSDVETAMMLVASDAMDAVLTDVEMPGINGLELCHKLTRLDVILNRRIPVWLMAGVIHRNLDVQARAVGAKGVFPKPLDETTVIRALKDALSPVAARRPAVRGRRRAKPVKIDHSS
jgi:two-component system, NtrC family, response regulator AtoC